MSKTKSWISAFRLRTLPLSFSGIIFGTFIAYHYDFWNTTVFVLALVTTLLFQIISNLANDLGDSLKGTDNENRVGPTRAVQSGEISKKEMKNAVILFSILALISSSFLIYFGTKDLTLNYLFFYAGLALLCVLAAITYTLGRKAYGYLGLGDIFVFIFFGLVSVLGVFTFYTKTIDFLNILPAITIGFLSTAVLNLNNMRDRINDQNSGKNTLVVKLGFKKAKFYHSFLIFGAILTLCMFIAELNEVWLLMALAPSVALVAHINLVWKIENERDFDPELKKVALSTFAISIFFMIGVILSKYL
jgi:1,4-dihydroxy-2-naphthoate octaprenyltransferase